MEIIICSNCGNTSNSEYKHCIFCGSNLKSEPKQDVPINEFEQSTFFCPKCMKENPKEEIICSNCGEDFGKYNIRSKFSDTSASRRLKSLDMATSINSETAGKSFNTRFVILIIVLVILTAITILLWVLDIFWW